MNLIKAENIPKNDILYKYSNPIKAQKNAYKYLGEDAILYKSTNTKKKYMIYDTIKDKFIHFGSLNPPHEDYLKHNDDIRQYKYLKRALNIKGDWFKNPSRPNSLSINILWA